MNLLIDEKVRKPGAPQCRCGAQPILVRKMLNSTNGVTVRMFECDCGKKILTENKE